MAAVEPKTYSVPEAARVLGVSKTYLYQLAGRGELPGLIRVGNRMVVSRAAIERLLAPDEAPAEA